MSLKKLPGVKKVTKTSVLMSLFSVIGRWEPGKVHARKLGRVANMSLGNTNSSTTLSEFPASVQRIEFILPTVRHKDMW